MTITQDQKKTLTCQSKCLILTIARYVLVSLFLAGSSQTYAHVLFGQVVGVSDGDTITLLDAKKNQHKIRFAGIDAPEKTQPFEQASKKKPVRAHLNWTLV